jgi:hypothetical protein
MSRFWPHTPYAEDQPYAHPILYTHVLTRAVQAGAVVGTTAGTALYLLRSFRILSPRAVPTTLTATIVRSAGVGSAVAVGLLTVGLPLRMRDQEEIQWKDRSWRLLENKGQLETDDWTYPGMALGLAAAVAARGRGIGWSGAVGRVGVGSVLGAAGYMGWRYGVNGGKREGDDKDTKA